MATATTSVKKAFDTQTDLKDHREHCASAARVLASLGSGLRQQVRIHRNGEFALYTVSELLHETTDSVVRMGLGGRQRLQSEAEFEGVMDTKVVDSDLSDKEARFAGELVERLRRRRLPSAPHRHRPPRRRHRGAHRRASRARGRAPRPAAGQRLAGQGLEAGRRRLRSLAHHLHRPQPDLLPPAQLGHFPALCPCRCLPRLRR